MIVDVTTSVRPRTSLALYRTLGVEAQAALGFDADTHIAEMDRNGVAMAGLVASVIREGVRGPLSAVTIDELQPILARHPSRYFGWCGIDPTGGMETLGYIERAVRELGFKGVHVYPHWFGIPIDHRTYWPIYAKCCELGVPVALQVGRQSPRSGAKLVARPALLEEIAFDFPDLKLIALHVGFPYENETTAAIRSHENVYVIADAWPPSSWSAHFIEFVSQRDWGNLDGAEKVMWGTNWPLQTMAQSLAELRALDIPQRFMPGILGGNAVRILGLDAPDA